MTTDTLFTTETPAGEFSDGAPGLDLGAGFWVDEDCTCVGVQVYLAASLVSGSSVQLYGNVSTALLASKAIAAPAHGWNTVMFDAPIDLTADVTYVAAYHTPGGYAATSAYWDTQHDSASGKLHGAASGVDVPGVDGETLRNGRVGVSATPAYPAGDSGGHANYWVGPIVQFGTPDPELHSGSASIALSVAPATTGHKRGTGGAQLGLGLALFALGRKVGQGAAAFGLAVRLANPSLRLIHGHLTAAGTARASLAASGQPASTLTAQGE